MGAMMGADVDALCGPKGRHDPDRTATRRQRGRVAAWIEDYNHDRRHSALGMLSPIAYERTHPTPDGPPPEQAA